MVKIYLERGLSSRVRDAITGRLQSAMAASASRPETEELPLEEMPAAEVPSGEVADAGENPMQVTLPAPTEEGKEDLLGEHGQFSWPGADIRDSDARDRSRSPKGPLTSATVGDGEVPLGDRTDYEKVLRELPEPTTPLQILQSCSSLAVGLTTLVASLKATNDRSATILRTNREPDWSLQGHSTLLRVRLQGKLLA